jgi:hypothetical protein
LASKGLGIFYAQGGKEKEKLRGLEDLLDALEDAGQDLEKYWENPYDWLYNINEKIN